MVFSDPEDAKTMRNIGLNVAALLVVTFMLITAAMLLA